MAVIIDSLSWLFLVTGSFVGISGGIGILRFPDFFTRLHAASVTDTLCAAFVLLGLVLQAGWGLAAVKLIFIMVFLFFTSPTATHALVRAALHSGLKPILHNDEDNPSKA
jgi:multicomponent Na+:H+ antiporter subunit G